jgi:hypothetical protein
LQVDDLSDSLFEPDLMAAFAMTESESGTLQNEAQVAEIEVGVGTSLEQCGQGFLELAHG